MATIKTIAIVGAAGKTGSTIARSLQGKYRLLLMSRHEEKAFQLKTEIDQFTPNAEVYAVSCAKDAAWEADIIIIATPYEAQQEVAEKIKEVAVGKLVISVGNAPDKSNGPATSEHCCASEELGRLLPYSRVATAAIAASDTNSVATIERLIQ